MKNNPKQNVSVNYTNNAGHIIDKQQAMQQSVVRNSNQSRVNVTLDPNSTSVYGTYRQGSIPIASPTPMKLSSETKGIVANTTSNTAITSAYLAGIYAVQNNNLANAGAGGFAAWMKSATFRNVDVVDNVTYADPALYVNGASITTANYTDATDDFVSAMSSGLADNHHLVDVKLARLAIALKDAVVSQSNSHNPFYAMRASEIFDRLMDYFRTISKVLVLYYNILGFIGAKEQYQSGAKRLWRSVKKATYQDANIVRMTDSLAEIKKMLLGKYHFDSLTVDYLDFAVVSLLPNQDGGFRYLIPYLLDPSLNVYSRVETGNLLFDHQAFAAVIGSVETAVSNALVYMNSSAAKLLEAGITGFNQFTVIKSLPDSYKLRLSPRLMNDGFNQMTELMGVSIMRTDVNAHFRINLSTHGVAVGTGAGHDCSVRGINRFNNNRFCYTGYIAHGGTIEAASLDYNELFTDKDPLADLTKKLVGVGDAQPKNQKYGVKHIVSYLKGLTLVVHQPGTDFCQDAALNWPAMPVSVNDVSNHTNGVESVVSPGTTTYVIGAPGLLRSKVGVVPLLNGTYSYTYFGGDMAETIAPYAVADVTIVTPIDSGLNAFKASTTASYNMLARVMMAQLGIFFPYIGPRFVINAAQIITDVDNALWFTNFASLAIHGKEVHFLSKADDTILTDYLTSKYLYDINARKID